MLPIVAIDGPSAAGKGTLARRLAAHFGFAHLDTGRIYRAVARKLLDRGDDPADTAKALAAAGSLSLADLEDPRLRGEAVAVAASKVAALPEVRAALLELQRRLGRNPPPGSRGMVVDGRDIGTIVFPDAPAKIYLVARTEERARRRYKELLDQGTPAIYGRVLADVIARDERDSLRAAAPLRPAGDALVLDTTDLDADAAFHAALAHIEKVLGTAAGDDRPA